jgi:hypothetical protein
MRIASFDQTAEMLNQLDEIIRFGDVKFLVECKRPFHEHTVRMNIEDAASQIERELERPENKAAFGVVAISLSRIFTQGNLACFAPADEGRRVINEALADIIEEHRIDWRVRDFLNFHERIVAVMFHLAVPWDIEGERLIHLSTANFVQAGKSDEGFRILKENLSKLDRESSSEPDSCPC